MEVVIVCQPWLLLGRLRKSTILGRVGEKVAEEVSSAPFSFSGPPSLGAVAQ